MPNINMTRIASKLDELFDGKVILDSNEDRSMFYSRSIAALATRIESGIDNALAANSVTDGYHDGGIDAIYNDEAQKKLILVQSKWRSDGSGAITHEEILSFIEGVKRIINLEFDGLNTLIQKKTADITTAVKSMEYKITCIFSHTGNQNISEYCMRPVNALLASTNDDTTEILEFKEFVQRDIFNYLASGQEPENICVEVLLNNWGVLEEPYKAYYGTISAGALGEWFSVYGNRLFEKNIRYYKGNTDVNQSMRKVLIEEPENFFYYNNGVKLLCKKISRGAAYSTNTKTGSFSLEGVSLVNGAQTTGTIGSLFSDYREQLDKATVQVQLIDLADADESYALQITKLSNSQNRIDSKEFAALDPEQERLKIELGFAGISYLYKSGSTVDDPLRQISIDDTIIALACLQSDVTFTATAKRNIGALTSDISKAPYKIMFNPTTNAYSMKNSVEVVRCVDRFLGEHEESFHGRNRLALVHGNRFITYLVLQQIKTFQNFDYKMIPRDELSRDVDTICAALVPNVIDAMNTVLPEAYPANIFKNVGRCKSLLLHLFPEESKSATDEK